MPALWITIDNIDGTSVMRGPVYPDEIDLTGLLFRLSRGDLATVTFTNASPLSSTSLAHLEKPDDRSS